MNYKILHTYKCINNSFLFSFTFFYELQSWTVFTNIIILKKKKGVVFALFINENHHRLMHLFLFDKKLQ